MYVRDLLETDFLLDYLMDEDGRPEDWLKADEARLSKQYSPKAIREALDKRDGFSSERERRNRYRCDMPCGCIRCQWDLRLQRDGMRVINAGPLKHTRQT